MVTMLSNLAARSGTTSARLLSFNRKPAHVALICAGCASFPSGDGQTPEE